MPLQPRRNWFTVLTCFFPPRNIGWGQKSKKNKKNRCSCRAFVTGWKTHWWYSSSWFKLLPSPSFNSRPSSNPSLSTNFQLICTCLKNSVGPDTASRTADQTIELLFWDLRGQRRTLTEWEQKDRFAGVLKEWKYPVDLTWNYPSISVTEIILSI